MPVWRDEHIEYDIFPSHLLTIQEDPNNYLKPAAAMYRQATGGPDSQGRAEYLRRVSVCRSQDEGN
jgi:hypothetical protein